MRPGDTLGAYEVLAELHAGGMGRVAVGRRRGAFGFEKLVAIKTLLGTYQADPAYRLALRDEARLLARLDHPNIAQVLDVFEEGTQVYLVLELVAGVTLDVLARRAAPLTPRAAVDAVAQTCRGLAHAHDLEDAHGQPLGVVHRDVSPDNVMITYAGSVKLIDFGIAFALEREQPVTAFGAVKGKPGYMAPEQWKGLQIDHRVDVFAAGVVLHELLTGARLFEGDSPYAMGMAVCSQPIEPPSAAGASVPEALDTIVMNALARDREERCGSALEMAQALEALAPNLDGLPLVELAAKTLDEERNRHERFVRGLSSAAPAGRAPDVSTVPDLPSPTTPAPTSGTKGTKLLLLLAAAAIAVGLFFASRRSAEDPVTKTAAPPTLPPVATATKTEAPPPPTPRKSPRRVTKRPERRERRPPKPVEPAPVEPASLTIFAEPYATVRIDGELIGNTPRYRVKTTAGHHVVELIHPADGSVRHRASIELAPNEHRRVTAPRIE
ncbi:MAG: serine/threonine-protein kinase [Deltaproteobacteria bacterium]